VSLRGKDFRCELEPELHERLRLMADFHDTDIASLGAKLLEKAICGDWHEFSLLVDRAARCGIARKGNK
jgi:hypothetical protein